MKQDETYRAIAEIVRAVQNGEQSIDNATNEIMSINHLLSKKPSVSDEEIEKEKQRRLTILTHSSPIDNSKREAIDFTSGAKWALSLPPQVVQSEVSELKCKCSGEKNYNRLLCPNCDNLTPPDAEKQTVKHDSHQWHF